MNSVNYENQLIGAIQTIVDDAIAKANFDKTIKATIVKCIDETIGKYSVKYQDSTFYAFSPNTENTYRDGTNVYILIPGNDTSQDKTIIGAVDKLGTDFISVISEDNAYEYVGNNCIKQTNEIQLCSYAGQTVLDVYNYAENINTIELDIQDVEEYIKKSTAIVCGLSVRTALPTEQRFQGNYGINFELVYLDNNNLEVIKNYIIDINQMNGNPYNLSKLTRQFKTYNIEGLNFARVNRIYVFCYDFPNTAEDKENDIFISNIEFTGANIIPSEELNSYGITFTTPKGTYFKTTDGIHEAKTIVAQLKIKGKIADAKAQNAKYYWFKENSKINAASEKYNTYGGNGWECLNDYNVIQEANSDAGTIAQIEWVPGTDTQVVLKSDILSKQLNYKCVILYGDSMSISKIITFYNYSSSYLVDITSTNGTKFTFDNGSTDLIMKINGVEEQGAEYSYVWSVVDKNNIITNFSSNEESTIAYNNAKTQYEATLAAITANSVSQESVQAQLNDYVSIIDAYENTIRVEGSRLINVKANTIQDYSTFKCSAYQSNNFIGTASITLTNSFEADIEIELSDYSLVINNSNQIFQYNENGVSPASRGLSNPQTILPLSFTLYNKLGNEINANDIAADNIIWKVPVNNTMLESSNVNGTPTIEDEYEIYTGLNQLIFEIRNTYSAQKRNNDIILQVKYDDHIITAKTTLMFIKQGEVGTNGTDIICKLRPNDINNQAVLPTVIYNKATSAYTLNYERPSAEADKWLKVELWENGNKIFEGTKSGFRLDDNSIPVTVKWSILKNTYSRTIYDYTNFNIDVNTGAMTIDTTDFITNGQAPANLVKCELTMLGDTYSSIIPINLVRISSNTYSINLNDYSGFISAMYLSDGTKPVYDSTNPFELTILKNGNEISQEDNTSYTWNINGQVYYTQWQSSLNLAERKGMNLRAQKNQRYYQPVAQVDGLCLSNSITCQIQDNGAEVGSITIPVYLYLNKYGHAALNGWDGNSVSIDNEGGVILTPQVGAGKKEDDNSFTGVFMGSVKKAGATKLETGLFGYNKGEQTIKLDAETGSASFGKSGSGQIIIDPTEGAKIRGGNYNYTGDDNGTGMEIDLSRPSIKYGSGKFELDEHGNLKTVAADMDQAEITNANINTATAENLIISGNSLFSVGTGANVVEIVNSNGLLTNLTYKSDTALLGFVSQSWEGVSWQKATIGTDIVIPENFIVEKATLNLHLYNTLLQYFPMDQEQIVTIRDFNGIDRYNFSTGEEEEYAYITSRTDRYYTYDDYMDVWIDYIKENNRYEILRPAGSIGTVTAISGNNYTVYANMNGYYEYQTVTRMDTSKSYSVGQTVEIVWNPNIQALQIMPDVKAQEGMGDFKEVEGHVKNIGLYLNHNDGSYVVTEMFGLIPPVDTLEKINGVTFSSLESSDHSYKSSYTNTTGKDTVLTSDVSHLFTQPGHYVVSFATNDPVEDEFMGSEEEYLKYSGHTQYAGAIISILGYTKV